MIDPPPAYEPGVLARLGGRFSPGIQTVLDTVQKRSEQWHRANIEALSGTDPLWVALGYSTAQAIGASSMHEGYVGQLGRRLDAAGRPHDVVNLARTGARIDHVLHHQLEQLEQLTRPPALVTCAVGSNDVIRLDSALVVTGRMRNLLCRLGALESTVVVATIPQGRSSWFARRANQLIRRDGPGHGLAVADVARSLRGPFEAKVAADRFHPNDAGYADWTEAFLGPLGLDSDLDTP
ncbi:MAG: SGNH/GDSL hydrolase family protein [Acidimicrobiia bacterium]|nr:SGNH/GDSL hydrolase family protein [Acidimicrobiia bacterium]